MPHSLKSRLLLRGHLALLPYTNEGLFISWPKAGADPSNKVTGAISVIFGGQIHGRPQGEAKRAFAPPGNWD